MAKRNVFITGVSSGMGYGLALRYLERTDVVFGVSRRIPDETLMSHPGFHHAALDLNDEGKVFGELKSLFGSVTELDTVVLNAGVLGEIADMKHTSLDQLRSVMNTNVWSNKTVIDGLFTILTY